MTVKKIKDIEFGNEIKEVIKNFSNFKDLDRENRTFIKKDISHYELDNSGDCINVKLYYGTKFIYEMIGSQDMVNGGFRLDFLINKNEKKVWDRTITKRSGVLSLIF
ncbi:hypothetical protein [Virgibacillus sp. DJP39]|uniref:hypothetical protein n=1 Tax=Virgibacillus sp. DJP39 TaxID=3409790 RepID=UPI003BB5CD01